MLFNSFEFLLFVVPVLALYFVLQHRPQNALLLVASYCFYGSWDWRFLGLIALSTLVDYVTALVIHRSTSAARRKAALLLSLGVNLGALGLFKYFNFFIDSFADLGFGVDAELLHLDLVLPVGISFYTFQTMSYTIDVYRGRLAPTTNLLDFAVYVAFFPQLVAGPIERATHFLPQIQSQRTLSYAKIRKGLWLLLLGYFFKVVLADNMAPIADAAFDRPERLSPAEVLTGIYAFAFQIYGDFAGYSAIARGLALLMGFDLIQNFRMPYLAVNPSDFWRRWHISLSTWLRDYLYISLGGNRRGGFRTQVNLMLTMLLGGLWHGASWHFIAWGGFHGALLILHRLASPILLRIDPQHMLWIRAWWLFRIAVFFQVTCIGWLLFRADSMHDVLLVVSALGGAISVADGMHLLALWGLMLALLLPIAVIEIAQERRGDMDAIKKWPPTFRLALYVLLACMIWSVGVKHGTEFIYFQF